MAHSGTLPMFQKAVNAMWAAEKAIAIRDIVALNKASGDINMLAAEIGMQRRMPGAFLTILYRRSEAINRDIDVWEKERERLQN